MEGPLRQWSAGNVYLLVLSSRKPLCANGVVDTFGQLCWVICAWAAERRAICHCQETSQFFLLTACTPWRDKIKLSKNQSFATQLCWVICAWAEQESYVCAAAKKLLSSCCSLHVARGPVTSVKWPSLRLLCYLSRTTDTQWEFFLNITNILDDWAYQPNKFRGISGYFWLY